MVKQPKLDPGVRQSIRHAAHLAALRMAFTTLQVRATGVVDPNERGELLKLARGLYRLLQRLEKRDLNNSEAAATWASLGYEDRKAYMYPDRARLEWIELEPWERAQLTYRMCSIFVGRIVARDLQRDVNLQALEGTEP